MKLRKRRSWAEKQRAHFDEKAPEYAPLYGKETPFHEAMTALLLERAGVGTGDEVLDLGCGFGRTTIPLLRRGCRVTGLDISAASLDALSERLSELGLSAGFEAVHQAVEKLEVEQCFRNILGRGILHHLEDPNTVLPLVRRALLPGGWVTFMDPNPLQPAWIPFITFHPTLSWSVERYFLRLTPGRCRRLLEAAGFEAVELSFLGMVPPPVWGRIPGTQRLERVLHAVPGLRRLGLYQVVRGRNPAE